MPRDQWAEWLLSRRFGFFPVALDLGAEVTPLEPGVGRWAKAYLRATKQR